MKPIPTLYSTLISALKSIPRSGKPVATVPNVDINRYMGRWYEIASYPQWFEKGLSRVSALYRLKGSNVEVINSGYKNGQMKRARGIAKVIDATNSKLKVSFFMPFFAQYWIVDLADDYSWVVVSNANRSTLWIMCRQKAMPQPIYRAILNNLQAAGFDVSKLVIMSQQ